MPEKIALTMMLTPVRRMTTDDRQNEVKQSLD
jgi:hypothetical protein